MSIIKIRQKKDKKNDPKSNSQYLAGKDRTWVDDERERNGESVRKTFLGILAVALVTIIVIIFALVNFGIEREVDVAHITAADTFAITQVEQQQMKEKATLFAQGLLQFMYCQEDDAAFNGKNLALSAMATETKAFNAITDFNKRAPIITYEAFCPVTTEPQLLTTTQTYASSFDIELDGAAVDLSITDEDNPYGMFADAGWHFVLTFSRASEKESGDKDWVISAIDIQRRTSSSANDNELIQNIEEVVDNTNIEENMYLEEQVPAEETAQLEENIEQAQEQAPVEEQPQEEPQQQEMQPQEPIEETQPEPGAVEEPQAFGDE